MSNDRRLRRQIDQLGVHFTAITADTFMVDLHSTAPDRVDAVIDSMVAKRVRRPVTRSALIDQLALRFPGLAAVVR